MDIEKDFKNSSIVISEVKESTETGQGKCIWEVKGWKNNFATLRANSVCTIKVGSDQKHAVRLFFGEENFKSSTRTSVRVPDPHRPNCTIDITHYVYVPLWVELKMVGCNDPVIDSPVIVSLDVYQLSENIVSENKLSGSVMFGLGNNTRAVIIEEFLKYSCTSRDNCDLINEVYVTQPENLRFGVIATISPINKTVTLKPENVTLDAAVSAVEGLGEIYKTVVNSADLDLESKDYENTNTCSIESSEKLAALQRALPEAALIEQFKKLYQSDVNFSDLKLETKDNKTLSTHKFIVAARSPMLHDAIKLKTEQQNFSGTIKVGVNSEPMLAILHYMYTGEVTDKAGLVMDQVIEGAKRFGMTELLKILDNEMISICTEDNMMSLYQAAKKCGMKTAMENIKSFISGKLRES